MSSAAYLTCAARAHTGKGGGSSQRRCRRGGAGAGRDATRRGVAVSRSACAHRVSDGGEQRARAVVAQVNDGRVVAAAGPHLVHDRPHGGDDEHRESGELRAAQHSAAEDGGGDCEQRLMPVGEGRPSSGAQATKGSDGRKPGLESCRGAQERPEAGRPAPGAAVQPRPGALRTTPRRELVEASDHEGARGAARHRGHHQQRAHRVEDGDDERVRGGALAVGTKAVVMEEAVAEPAAKVGAEVKEATKEGRGRGGSPRSCRRAARSRHCTHTSPSPGSPAPAPPPARRLARNLPTGHRLPWRREPRAPRRHPAARATTAWGTRPW